MGLEYGPYFFYYYLSLDFRTTLPNIFQIKDISFGLRQGGKRGVMNLRKTKLENKKNVDH